MAFDASFVIRVGSAALFVLLGLFLLAFSQRRNGVIALGAVLAGFGSFLIVVNLARSAGETSLAAISVDAFVVATVAFSAVCVVASCFVIGLMPRPVQRNERGAIAYGVAVGMASTAFVYGKGVDAMDAIVGLDGASPGLLAVARIIQALHVVAIGAMVAVASARVATGPRPDRAALHRAAALSASFGIWWIFQLPSILLEPTSLWSFAADLVMVVGLTLPWLVAAARTGERFALRMALLWPALALASYAYQLLPANHDALVHDAWGLTGISRIAGWSFLVFGILRADLLGVKLPHFAVSRGFVGAGALALLFIVAQVAQNFFSAKYGLIMGGVLAGGFVFAASPIQRAIERNQGATASASGRRTAATARTADVDIDEAYKAAVRAAMRDGVLTRREERHLAEVATSLRIDAVQALDLRDEVEREGVR